MQSSKAVYHVLVSSIGKHAGCTWDEAAPPHLDEPIDLLYGVQFTILQSHDAVVILLRLGIGARTTPLVSST